MIYYKELNYRSILYQLFSFSGFLDYFLFCMLMQCGPVTLLQYTKSK